MSTPTTPQSKNQLHGLTLEVIVTDLVAFFGWEELGRRIAIGCFIENPSVSSSLKFLRKTPWARTKVEGLYLFVQRERARQERRAAREKAGEPAEPEDDVDDGSLFEATTDQGEAPADPDLGGPRGEPEPSGT